MWLINELSLKPQRQALKGLHVLGFLTHPARGASTLDANTARKMAECGSERPSLPSPVPGSTPLHPLNRCQAPSRTRGPINGQCPAKITAGAYAGQWTKRLSDFGSKKAKSKLTGREGATQHSQSGGKQEPRLASITTC